MTDSNQTADQNPAPDEIPKVPQGPAFNAMELPPPPHQSRNFLLWIIIFLLGIGLFFAGYFLSGGNKSAQIKNLKVQVNSLEKEKDDLTAQVSELEQKVKDLDLGILNIPYQNAEYNYQFSYPSDLNFIDYTSPSNRTNLLALEKDNKTIVVIKVGRRERPDDEYLGVKAQKTLKISGQTATFYEFAKGYVNEGKRSDPFVAYKIVVESTQYILEFFGSTNLSETQSKVLNSFKFIEATQGSGNIFGF